MNTAMILANRQGGSINAAAAATGLRKLNKATVAPAPAPTGPAPRF